MRRSSKLCWALGCILIVGSLSLLVFFQLRAQWARKNAAQLTQTIQAMLPPETPGIMDDYSAMEMPVLQVEGQDFCALVEIPAYGLTLPVYDTWDTSKLAAYPCRFWGSVYDGSLIIGGADQAGQFDFFDRIQPGAEVSVTDVTGARFKYTVTGIQRYDSIPAETLVQEEAGLTLFVRDAHLLHYILLRCSAY